MQAPVHSVCCCCVQPAGRCW